MPTTDPIAARAPRLARALDLIEADSCARQASYPSEAAVALAGLVHLLAVRVWVERGATLEEALEGTQQGRTVSTDGAVIRAVLVALAGSVARFDALEADRKVCVLRFAVACFAQFTGAVRWSGQGRVAWGPEQESVGPEAWTEVAGVYAARVMGVAA